MANAKIKKDFEETVIAFGNNGLPLGKRSEAEINQLAINALESKSPSLLAMFETLPTVEELKEQKTNAELKSLKPADQAPSPAKNK